MKPFLQIRLLILGVLFAAAIFGSPAFASTDLVSAADSQHFEQTYEDWAKSVLKNLNPKLDFTVLSRVEFSRNPERIQDYEDIKAASHLPGLPDMSDPNYTNPLDSPLYALVAKKNFKIIFYSNLSAQEIDLAREVLTSKLRISNEDALNFEYLNRSAAAPKKIESKMRVTESTLFTLISGIALLMGAFFSLRNKNSLTIQKAAARFSVETVAEKKAATAEVAAVKPVAALAANLLQK